MNLIERAHANARAKGFWNYESPESFPAKCALIATEVRELEIEDNPSLRLEEIADTVIRSFDLLGWLGAGECGFFAASSFDPALTRKDLADELYRLCADTVIAHRSGLDIVVASCLTDIIQECVDYCSYTYGDGALEQAVLAKMEKNDTREYLHGRPY